MDLLVMLINFLILALIIGSVLGGLYYLVGLAPTPPVPGWVKLLLRAIIVIVGLIICLVILRDMISGGGPKILMIPVVQWSM